MKNNCIVRVFQIFLFVFFCISDSCQTESSVNTNCTPVLITPQSGEIIDNGCYNQANGINWYFEWSDCPDALKYRLYVKQSSASSPVIDKETTNTFYSFSILSNSPSTSGWTWKVEAYIGGAWREWSEARPFNLEPVDTDCNK
jgi:hypothetical protein